MSGEGYRASTKFKKEVKMKGIKDLLDRAYQFAMKAMRPRRKDILLDGKWHELEPNPDLPWWDRAGVAVMDIGEGIYWEEEAGRRMSAMFRRRREGDEKELEKLFSPSLESMATPWLPVPVE